MIVLYDQTTFSDAEAGTHGDCCRACVSTLLQVQPESLPHPLRDDGEWNTRFFHVLQEIFGLAIRSVDHNPKLLPSTEIYDTSWGDFRVPRLVMAAGMSPRNVRHAVIYDRLAQRMVHDPHPSRAGILEIEAFDYLAPYPAPEAI